MVCWKWILLRNCVCAVGLGEHYVPADKRDRSWHPVVHEEMKKKDNDKSFPNQHRNNHG